VRIRRRQPRGEFGVDVLSISALNADGLDRCGLTCEQASRWIRRLVRRRQVHAAHACSDAMCSRQTTCERTTAAAAYDDARSCLCCRRRAGNRHAGMREFRLSNTDGGVDSVDIVFGDIRCAQRGLPVPRTVCTRPSPAAPYGQPSSRGELEASRLAAYEKLVKELRYEESRDDRPSRSRQTNGPGSPARRSKGMKK